MSDALTCGRRFRTFNVVDDFNREALHIEVDTSINSQRLVRVFEQIKRDHGLPQVVRSDNGPEFLGETFAHWLKANGVALQYIQPGKPNQNAFIERFNRTFREEVLDRHLFARLDDVREATHWWMIDYNEERSHDSLGGMPPSNTATNTPKVLLLKCLLDGGAYDRAYGMQHLRIDYPPTVAISTDERAFFSAFGERLAQQRKAQGLTQVQLAEALGVSQQAVTAYENGQRRVPISLLPLLARTLGVTVEDLIGVRSHAAPASVGRRRRFSSNSNRSKRCPRPSNAPSRRCSTRCSRRAAAKKKPRTCGASLHQDGRSRPALRGLRLESG
jgi:putative transposase